jgi:NADPH2:quinone reductase
MRAWQVLAHGEPEKALSLAEIPVPAPGPGQLLVRVRAVALNFPDVLLCRGEYQIRPELPFTPGVELCGEVAGVGPGVDPARVGSRVIGNPVLPHGALAEYTLMTAAEAFDAPAGLDDAEAAAFHIGYQTAWFALHRRAALKPGETVLVHAAAGGVGSAAVQVAKAAGARVIGVVGGAAKARAARELGADLVVDRTEEDFAAAVKQATGGRGADVVFDPVGGAAYAGSAKCVAFEGRIVVVGFAGGAIPAPPLNHALVKNYAILGLHWGLYKLHDPASVAAAHQDLRKLADEGVIKPLISRRIGLDRAPEALAALGSGATTGRVAVVPAEQG